VYRNVGSGYLLKHYPERLTFWDARIQTQALDSFVNALFDEYLGLVDGFKGREKYTSLQVQWMELLCCIQYEPTSQKANSQLPEVVIGSEEGTNSAIYKPTECAILTLHPLVGQFLVSARRVLLWR